MVKIAFVWAVTIQHSVKPRFDCETLISEMSVIINHYFVIIACILHLISLGGLCLKTNAKTAFQI